MKLRGYYIKKDPSKLNIQISHDKNSKDRPAWIQIKGLPPSVNFISIHLGKKGKGGKRIQFYKTYLPPGLFLPIDYTKQEMKEFYNKFSDNYNKELKDSTYNLQAGKFLCEKLKRFTKTNKSILDLGAGTGWVTEIYFDSGFKDITLLDYSPGMLNKAKKRKKLKRCQFILADINKIKLKKRFDIIISHFSLGSSSYFNNKELKKSLVSIKKLLKHKGIIATLGHFHQDLFEKEFKKLDAGVYTLDKKRGFYTDYFIGKKA